MNQNAIRNNSGGIIEVKKGLPDRIGFWLEAYFRFEMTTSQASRKVQKWDLGCFLDFMIVSEGKDDRVLWAPRLSRAFKDELKNKTDKRGKRQWSDRTINRILAHLKTFSKWVHKYRAFPLGNPGTGGVIGQGVFKKPGILQMTRASKVVLGGKAIVLTGIGPSCIHSSK